MIILYEKDTTSFSNNGICILDPVSCEVHEVVGGQYELELQHPLDDLGKHLMLTEERLIKAPVPPTFIPETIMPQLDVIKTTEQVTLYSKVPVTKYNNPNWRILRTVAANQGAYTYVGSSYYNAGAVVLALGGGVFRAKTGNLNSPTSSPDWEFLGGINDVNSTVDGGSVVATLAANTKVYKIADAAGGTYINVRTQDGKTGFISAESCTTTTEHYQETIPSQTITEQVFRIYEVASDDDNALLTVRAKHISYDYARNGLYECKVTNVTPAEAIAAIQSAYMMDESRRIACNISSGEITGDWSFKNPLNALLDPDNGLLKAMNAKLIRNNDDFFLLDDSTPVNGISIEYGVNMQGVRWSRNIENTVTRIIPRSGNSENGYIYIENGGRISGGSVQDQGKNYVESEIADTFAKPIILPLNCSYTVGQEYEQPDGTKVTYDESTVKAKMLQDALDKFIKDGVDGADISLDVEFILMGDTEEYKQYRGLQRVNLYDMITVKTGRSGIVARARVIEYYWDCLTNRYNRVVVGKIDSFSKRIPGYRVVNESVTYEKLSPDLINRILTDNASASTNTGGGGSSAGGDANPVVSNAVSDYAATLTYALNKLVVYDGSIWRCTTAISTPEAWDATHWTKITS